MSGGFKLRFTWRRVVIVKATVATGILAAHFLPPSWAIVVSSSANLLWLYSD